MAVSNFSPDANPETTTVDGWVRSNDTTTDWTSLRGQAGTAADDSSATAEVGVAGGGASGWKRLRRAPLLFNVSIPAGATITSAKLRLYATAESHTLEDMSLVIVACNPTSNTALEAGDYANAKWDFTAALSATKALSTFTTSAYNDLTLNAGGLADIVNGVVKFGVVLEKDRTDVDPGSNVDNNTALLTFATADSANPPILEVAHTGSDNAYSFFM